MCFEIRSKLDGCDSSAAARSCCDQFRERLTKVVLTADPRCRGAIQNVTVNGVRKGGGVFFDMYDNDTRSELRLTNLQLDAEGAEGALVCVSASAPCERAELLCRDRDNGGACRYAVFDPEHHMCCPTCAMPTMTAATLMPSPSPVPRPGPTRRPPPPTPPPPALVLPLPAEENDVRMTCTCSCAVDDRP